MQLNVEGGELRQQRSLRSLHRTAQACRSAALLSLR
jgi:hypothetical protein